MNDTAQLEGLNNLVANELLDACTVTQLLATQGVKVFAAMANGRRPLLMCDRMPAGVVTGVKCRYPNGKGGTTLVHAATYAGCQLEWMQDVPGVSPVLVERAKPRLEVVRAEQ